MRSEPYRDLGPFRMALAAQRDPLDFFTRVVNASGDFARIQVLSFRFYVVNDPELIREALIERSETMIIKGGASAGLARLIGHGILTNRGDDWRTSRRDLQPLFNQDLLDTYPAIIRELGQESIDRWKSEFSGRGVPLSREVLMLSFRIGSSALFRYLPTFMEAEAFADAMWVLQSDGMRSYLQGLGFVGGMLPLGRRVSAAKRTFRKLAAKISANGSGHAVDEILSLLFAGTESPANTVVWAMKLVEDRPELRDAGDPELQSRILAETLRLYPAGWAFERFATRDSPLGKEVVKKGSRLFFSPYLLHRNPRFWRDPGKFDPERFIAGAQSAPPGVPKYAYLPFGAGPRSCIGSRMAWLEMRILLEMFFAQCRWKIGHSPADRPPEPKGSFKIRFDRPLFAEMTFPGG